VAAVEFAVVSTVLFMLVFGIIQFGLTLSKIETFENAARHGARVAAVSDSSREKVSAIKSDVVDASNYGISDGTNSDEAAITVAVSKTTGGSFTAVSSGAVPCDKVAQTNNWQVKVSWTQKIQISIPFLPNMTITRPIAATFRCEPKAG